MAGFTNAEAKATLDARFPSTGATDAIAWSSNGTSESSAIARTAIGATGWGAATTADPSVKANSTALTSAAASAAVTVTHAATYSAATGGTQRTDWQPLDQGSRTLAVGDQLSLAVGAHQVTLT